MPTRSKEVFLLEDDPISSELVCAMLRRNGYSVTAFEEGAALLARLNGHSGTGSILMDMHTPGESGFALAKRIRSTLPSFRLIAISASHSRPEELGPFHAFLLKPIDEPMLKAVLGGEYHDDSHDSATPERNAISESTFSKFAATMSAASLNELYAAYFADTRRRLATLQSASAELAAQRAAAHAVKGASAMLGLTRAAAAAAAFESCGPQTSATKIAALTAALAEEVSFAQSAVANRLAKP
jgi:CheY-like chemotaxis protein